MPAKKKTIADYKKENRCLRKILRTTFDTIVAIGESHADEKSKLQSLILYLDPDHNNYAKGM